MRCYSELVGSTPPAPHIWDVNHPYWPERGGTAQERQLIPRATVGTGIVTTAFPVSGTCGPGVAPVSTTLQVRERLVCANKSPSV